MISIRFFFRRGRSNRRTRISTPNSKDAKSGRSPAAEIAAIVRNVHGRIALGISAADRGHRSRIGVVAVENHGATLRLAAGVPLNTRLRPSCPTWTSNFDLMNTVSIPWRAKSK